MNPEFLHDLRQPLTAIKNFTRACINELHRRADADKKVLGWLESANQQARRASEMLQEAKTKGSAANRPPVPIDIKRCIENVLDGLRRASGISAGAPNAEYDNTSYYLLGDPALLEPVFRDLLVGALGPLPRTDIITWNSIVDIDRENADLVLEIDAAATVSNLAGTVNVAGAKGRECSALIVGLSACEAIIERHGGSLTLWRREDGTLRVRTRFPAYQQNGGTA